MTISKTTLVNKIKSNTKFWFKSNVCICIASVLLLFSCRSTKPIVLKNGDHIHPDKCKIYTNPTGSHIEELFIAFNETTWKIDTFSMDHATSCLDVLPSQIAECACVKELLDNITPQDETILVNQPKSLGRMPAYYSFDGQSFWWPEFENFTEIFPPNINPSAPILTYLAKWSDRIGELWCDTLSSVVYVSLFPVFDSLMDPQNTSLDKLNEASSRFTGILNQKNDIQRAFENRAIPDNLMIDHRELKEAWMPAREISRLQIQAYNKAWAYRINLQTELSNTLPQEIRLYQQAIRAHNNTCPTSINTFKMGGHDLDKASRTAPILVEWFDQLSRPDSTIATIDTLESSPSCFYITMQSSQSFNITSTCPWMSYNVSISSIAWNHIGNFSITQDGENIDLTSYLQGQPPGIYNAIIIASPNNEVQTVRITKP